MKVGISLPHSGAGPAADNNFVTAARAVERLGFDGLWFFDAIGRGFMDPDPLIAATVAASVTERIEVGTCILQVPLRRPVELAHRALTAHVFSGGRFSLGVGAGSTKADFDAVGVDYQARFRLLAEALPIMRKLWRGETVGTAILSPWPGSGDGPPFLIGSGAGSRWISKAAQEYDGWIASGRRSTWSTMVDGIKRFRDLGGKRAIVTNVAVDSNAETKALAMDEPFHLRCDAAAARARLEQVAELGYDDIILAPQSVDEAHLTEVRALLPV